MYTVDCSYIISLVHLYAYITYSKHTHTYKTSHFTVLLFLRGFTHPFVVGFQKGIQFYTNGAVDSWQVWAFDPIQCWYHCWYRWCPGIRQRFFQNSVSIFFLEMDGWKDVSWMVETEGLVWDPILKMCDDCYWGKEAGPQGLALWTKKWSFIMQSFFKPEIFHTDFLGNKKTGEITLSTDVFFGPQGHWRSAPHP